MEAAIRRLRRDQMRSDVATLFADLAAEVPERRAGIIADFRGANLQNGDRNPCKWLPVSGCFRLPRSLLPPCRHQALSRHRSLPILQATF